MGLDLSETPRANGLKTAIDVLVAPTEGFQQVRAVPTWGWALLLTLLLCIVGSYLTIPAIVHGLQADWPRQVAANPRIAAMPADQQQKMLGYGVGIVRFAWIVTLIFVPILILIQTVIMLVFKAIGKGDASFAQLWAAAVNISLPALGINSLVTAAIVLVRGADSFASAADVQTAMPSLALLVPTTAIKLHAFLAVINPFTLWALGLTVGAMTIVARVARPWAWSTGIVLLLISAGLAALGAR